MGVNRALGAAIAAALALAPITAGAASPKPSPVPSKSATPSPTGPVLSPALSTVLAKAPAGNWIEAAKTATGVFEGAFTAQQYISLGTTSDAAAARATLEHDGFVAGYGRTWLLSSSQHALVEAVIAFTGDVGAKDWLASSETADKSDPTYKGPLKVSGISVYYGVRLFDSTTKIYYDAFAFVKGNDFFVVGSASTTDDKGATATAQTTAQYKFAPAYTIPPSKWPAPPAAASAFDLGALAKRLVFVALIIVVAILGFIWLRSRRRSTAGAAPGGEGALTMQPGIVQLSADGNFWWDGQTWRNATFEAPPTAQRTPDGAFWWDGATWRQVPVPPPPS